jgi:hypothetical protein
MAKFKTTHILIIEEDQVGEGSEDAKGCITLRLHPAIKLSWRDELDIRLKPVVGNPNKAARGKK